MAKTLIKSHFHSDRTLKLHKDELNQKTFQDVCDVTCGRGVFKSPSFLQGRTLLEFSAPVEHNPLAVAVWIVTPPAGEQ